MTASKFRSHVEVIIWEDAVTGGEWKAVAHVEKPQRCTSIGLVVVENRRYVVLAGSWGPNDEGEMETNNRMVVPKGFIINRTEVTIPGLIMEKAK